MTPTSTLLRDVPTGYLVAFEVWYREYLGQWQCLVQCHKRDNAEAHRLLHKTESDGQYNYRIILVAYPPAATGVKREIHEGTDGKGATVYLAVTVDVATGRWRWIETFDTLAEARHWNRYA